MKRLNIDKTKPIKKNAFHIIFRSSITIVIGRGIIMCHVCTVCMCVCMYVLECICIYIRTYVFVYV